MVVSTVDEKTRKDQKRGTKIRMAYRAVIYPAHARDRKEEKKRVDYNLDYNTTYAYACIRRVFV